ncbi:hypothetical protein DL96DRAFT_1729598 [Flagelloscypha sp. PMI_526]|nr:hypothetical protein DL96DRAFT_1729598 [Flagelloscypha sp. PMI_526]
MSLVSPFLRAVAQKRQDNAFKTGSVFTLSDDLALEPIFIIMSRIAIPSLYAYAAVLAVFIAALLDLSQQLFRGATNVQAGLGLDAVRGFLDAREIFFSLSFGFRFLFFWATVATGYGRQGAYNTSHFASWDRWGALGAILKYSTLVAVLVPVLQALWRLGPGNATFYSIYLADSTFQIVLSGLFLMKVFLTFVLVPPTQRTQALIHYALPISALGLSLALGIISLVTNLFSEMTLGRFLQAIELYTMLLAILVLLKRGSCRNLSSPFLLLDCLRQIIWHSSQQVELKSEGEAVSLVFPPGLLPRPAPPDPNQVPVLTKRHDIELGMTLPSRPAPRFAIDVNVPRQMAAPVVRSPRDWDDSAAAPPSPARSPRRGALRTPTALTPTNQTLTIPSTSRQPEFETPSPLLLPMQPLPPPSAPPESPPPQRPLEPPTLMIPSTPGSRPESSGSSFIAAAPDFKSDLGIDGEGARPVTDISLASYYRTEPNSPLTSMKPPPSLRDVERQDSPIYGLNGIVRNLPQEDGEPAPGTPVRASGSSFDQLLKEQQALDNSIRMLKLFSPRDTVVSTSSEETALPAPKAPALKSAGRASGSDALTSEFSLSVFPDPPEPAETITRARRVVVGPRSPLGQDQFPNTDSTLGEPAGRLDSAITQYEITSFIANPQEDESRNNTLTKTEVAQRPSVAAASAPQLLRPLLLNTSVVPEVQSVPYTGPKDPLKPLMLGFGRGGRIPARLISGPRPPRLEEGKRA